MEPGIQARPRACWRPQNSSTSPGATFTTNSPGNHSHGLPYRTGFGSSDGTDAVSGDNESGSPNTLSSGNHSHSITGGGNAETRPENAYVFYIIRI